MVSPLHHQLFQDSLRSTGSFTTSKEGDIEVTVGKCIGQLMGSIIGLGILIAGIVLWAKGASTGNAGMLLAGKIITGINIAGTGLTVTCCYCACCILGVQRLSE